MKAWNYFSWLLENPERLQACTAVSSPEELQGLTGIDCTDIQDELYFMLKDWKAFSEL